MKAIGNREYRSDVFSMLMEDKANALSLYNAVNNSNYDNPDDVEIYKLDKGISLSVRNDASFILDAHLSVYEHQSTMCPNMPIRSLIYYSNMVERLVKNKNVYGSSKVFLPTPHFAVFYNGDLNQPDIQYMKLSDLFEAPVENPELELTCVVYNINKGHNEQIMKKCQFLREYMVFVDYVRDFYRAMDYNNIKDAIERAIDRCIEEDVLKGFLIKNRWEVVKVVELDYTHDRQIQLEREEGREEGRVEERITMVAKLLKIMSPEDVKAAVDVTDDEIRRALELGE